MFDKRILIIAAVFLMVGTAAAFAVTASQKSLVDRGEYLVNSVATCGDCHTPRLQGGRPDMKRALTGCSLDIKPIAEVPGWASYAPNITGEGVLKGRTDEEMVRFFMTGNTKSGRIPGPPHPRHRLNLEDARAVTAYLRSLPAQSE